MPVFQDKESKTWYVKCYYIDYMGTKRQRKKRGFKLQREAKEWEAIFLSSLKYDNETTFGHIAKQFLEEMEPRRRITTMRLYRVALARILPTFEDVPLGKIDEQMIVRWQNDMLSRGYSGSTGPKSETIFRQVFRYGAKRCQLPRNPFDNIEKLKQEHTRELQFWTHDQYKEFYKHLNKTIHQTAFDILFYGGIRLGELLALTVADFDSEGKTLSITKSLQREGKTDHITPPKTKKGNRTITLPSFVAEKLAIHIESLYDCDGETRLFPISKNALYCQMKKYSPLAGVPRIRIHDLRHSHAALLIEKGIQPLAIAERLGHEDIKITLGTYGHLYPNKQREIADILEQI